MGVVYLLQHGDSAWYKIGRARDSAHKRKRQGLSTGNPENLIVIHAWDCGDEAAGFETRLHSFFAADRLRDRDATEFFAFTDIVGTVDRIHILHEEYMDHIACAARVAELPQVSDDLVDMDADVTALIATHRRLQAEIKQRTFDCCVNDTKLKALIGTRAGAGHADNPIVTWHVQTPDRLDYQQLKTEYPDVYRQCLRSTSSRVLRIRS